MEDTLPADVSVDRARLVRAALALPIGWICFYGVLAVAFGILRALWPAYDAAVPDRAYSLAMLITRLAIFATAIGATSIVGTRLVGDRRMPWITGVLIFLASIPPHFHPGTVWDEYPVWYHYTYLASIVPIALVAGRVLGNRERGDDR